MEAPAPGRGAQLTWICLELSLSFTSSTSGYAQVTKEEYARVGSKQLGQQLEEQLRQQGKKPYVISVGGSDATGTFGYLAATQEILEQAGKDAFTDIVNVSHHIFICSNPVPPHAITGVPWKAPLYSILSLKRARDLPLMTSASALYR